MSNTPAATATDPNGWIKNPPATFVTVHGTSRESINGCRGLVLNYDATKTRYLLLLVVSQQQVSLKSDNLRIASLVEHGRGYLELMQHSPEVQRQVQRVVTVLRQRTNDIIAPKYLLLGLGLITLLSCFFWGVTPTMLLLSLLILVIMVVWEDVLNPNLNWTGIARNAPNRWQRFIRENIPMYGHRIADHTMYLYAFTGLVAVLTIYPLLVASFSSSRGRGGSSSNSQPTAAALLEQRGGGEALSSSVPPPEVLYKLGYDDATSNLEFGASLAEFIATTAAAAATRSLIDNDAAEQQQDDEEWLPPTTSSMHQSSSQLFSVSTALSVFAIVRTVYPLGHDVNNNGGRWNYQLALTNFQTLPTWRLALLGFALYRLVAAVFS
jgi:hypothetical protein